MPKGPAKTADDITDTIRSVIDRMVDTSFTQELAKRGQDVAELLAERGAEVGSMANEAWRDSRPLRRDAAKRFARATNDATKWSDTTWRKSVRPTLKDLWKRRALALGAAGAAVPAGRELMDTAASRLGLKQREERHWGAFFLGLLLGAAAGAIVALLTTPKRGSEMRQELGARADEIAARAKDVDWVPIFQRDDGTNGRELSTDESVALQDAAADEGAATGEAADQAATDVATETVEAFNESYESADRESTT